MGEKKAQGTVAVVLKVHMHCEGCVKEIIESVNGFEGVEDVKIDSANNKMMVIGKVDPLKLREKLERKTKKKVELISPQPKSEAAKKKPEEKSYKKPEIVILKTTLHCQGCIDKIRKSIRKIEGVEAVSIDREKDLVMVKGTMDSKSLPSILKRKLKKHADIVVPKKDGEGKKKDGGQKKEKENTDTAKKNESNRRDFGPHGLGNGYGYPYPLPYPVQYGPPHQVGYGYPQHGGYGPPPHQVRYGPPPHQMFSDENPNGCSVM